MYYYWIFIFILLVVFYLTSTDESFDPYISNYRVPLTSGSGATRYWFNPENESTGARVKMTDQSYNIPQGWPCTKSTNILRNPMKCKRGLFCSNGYLGVCKKRDPTMHGSGHLIDLYRAGNTDQRVSV